MWILPVFPQQFGVGAADVVGVCFGGIASQAECKPRGADPGHGSGEGSPFDDGRAGESRTGDCRAERSEVGREELDLAGRQLREPVGNFATTSGETSCISESNAAP